MQRKQFPSPKFVVHSIDACSLIAHDFHNDFPGRKHRPTFLFQPHFQSRITAIDNGADWNQLSDLSSSYFLTYRRGHTALVVRFRSRYRQPCHFYSAWGDGVKRGEKVKKKKEKKKGKKKGEKKEGRNKGGNGGARWMPPPFRFRPASLTNPANQALLFSNTNEPSERGEGIFFLSSTETTADHRRFLAQREFEGV